MFYEVYRKSMPTPMLKPRARRSPRRATSGIEKLSSIRSGSKRYMSPTPAETLGIDAIFERLSTNERSEGQLGQSDGKQLVAPTTAHAALEGYSRWSYRDTLPPFTNAWILSGQCSFPGIGRNMLAPRAYARSPPKESTAR